MEKLKSYFERNGITGEDLTKILSKFTLKSFKKSELLVEHGKSSPHLGYVESGMFQYYILAEGEETTTYVATENMFITSLIGYFSELPTQENIRALMNGKVWMINKSTITGLIHDIPKFKDFYIALLEWHICAIENSRHDLIRLTAEQRYEKILKQEPHLLEHIPLQYLAAILGVTPRHLSRIRKNFS